MAQLRAPKVIGSQGKVPGEWIGSTYVGPQGTGGTGGGGSQAQVSPAPKVVGSQGKKPGEWIGSKYIGPALSPVVPPIIPGQAGRSDDGTTGYPTGPIGQNPPPLNYPGGSPNPMPRTMATSPDGSPPSTSSLTPRAYEGFDQTKFADPTLGTSHKYVGGRIAAGGGSADDILADPKFAGWTKVSDDKVMSPEGSIYDFRKDMEGDDIAQWTYVGGGPGKRNDGIPGNYAAEQNGGGGGQQAPAPATNPWAGYGTSGGTAPTGGQSSSFPTYTSGVNGIDDPLGESTNNALMRLLEGNGQVSGDPLSELINNSLMDRINSGSDENFNMRFESITEDMNRGRKSQTNNAMAALADRGILGEPGHQSGPEIGALMGIENDIAPIYSQAIRDAMADADDSELDTLGLASTIGQQNTGNLLNTINSSTAHQGMLAKVALDSLSQNMAWNQFLAEFGLQREQVMWEMENGGIENVLALIQMFAQQAQAVQKGYV